MKSTIKRILTGADDPDPTKDHTREYDRHEGAKEHIEVWPKWAGHLVYCELCQQVFTSGDVFSDHRNASEHEMARWQGEEEGWIGRSDLWPGDEFPDEATVGEITACEPTEESEL